jgi:hypothetical protein
LCAFNIHISCVGGGDGGGGGGGDGGGGGGGGIRSSPGNNVAKYLMKQSFKVAINLATNGMASAVLAAISS